VSGPRYAVPEWVEIFDFLQSIDGVARGYLGTASRREANNCDVVAASLERCMALIGDAVRLVKSESRESVGVILRTVYETWLVGTYASLGGGTARERLIDQYNFEIRYMLTHLDAPVEEVPTGHEFKIWDYATSVRDLFEELSHPQANFSIAAYNSLYRYESLFSIHAGLGSIGLRVSDDDHCSIINVDPSTDESLRHRVLLGATLYLALSRSVALCERLDFSDSQPLEDWVLSLRPEDG
jgi:hypothetical protein